MSRLRKFLMIAPTVVFCGGFAIVNACHPERLPDTPPEAKKPVEIDVDVKIDPIVTTAVARVEALSAREIDVAVEAAIARAKERMK